MKRWPSVLLCLLALPGLSRAAQAHAVVSPAVPDAVFHVDDGLVALPTLQFPIRDQTDAERRLFVDVSGGIVRRMLVLQFETVKPGSDFRFVFPPKPPRNFGPHVYRFGAYAYDDAAAAAREPALEAARTRAALLARGLQAPRFWQVVRLARVADAAGQHEAIVFNMENADARYPDGLVDVDEDGDGRLRTDEIERLWHALMRSLEVVPAR